MVKVHYAFRTARKLCLIIDLIPGEPLNFDWPNDIKSNEEEIKICLASMVIGLEDMHSKGVVHLDNHPANYVIDQYAYPILIDFGCA